jgi:hypothetical protein
MMYYSLRSSNTLLLAVTVVVVIVFNSGGRDAFSPSKMIIMRQNKQQISSATKRATASTTAITNKGARSTPSATPSALFVSTTTRSSEPVAEEDARYIFNKAREFAFKDEQQQQQQQQQLKQQNKDSSSSSSSNSNSANSNSNSNNDTYDLHYHSLSDEKKEIKEAKFYLNEIIHLQSGCVAGTLVDTDQDGMCDADPDSIVAEIVTKLTQKVKRHELRLQNYQKYSSSSKESSAIPWIATELSVGALLLVVAAFVITLDIDQNHGDDIGPIENYQHFINILHDKGYFVSSMNMIGDQFDSFSQHIMNMNA